MEKIWQAVERAKADPRSSKSDQYIRSPSVVAPQLAELEIDPAYLLSRRIVAVNSANPYARSYDILRTQVSRSMEQHGWKTLGVTSPTAGCGKTLTAINLAFSMARQENHSVMLADLDLRKPQVTNYLGLSGGGVLDVLDNRTTLRDATTLIRSENHSLAVLGTTSSKGSSERMASRGMRALLHELKNVHQSLILDLPPMLPSDDVISVLPQVDCILLVAAIGQSKASEIEESVRQLESTPLVRVVLNKATEESADYYY
jgi:protein-tyrosine kinase